MHAIVGRDDLAPGQQPTFHASFPDAPQSSPSGYAAGEGYVGSGPSWSTIGLIVLVHAIVLFALVKLDVVSLPKVRKPPLVVELIAEPPAPPPVAQVPEQKVAEVEPPETPIVAPPPIVAVPQSAPPPVATTPEPPAPQAVAVAKPAAAPGPAAPITPPDASAANLGNDAPRYPIESRRKREEGTVRLRVVITVDGRVKEISVARSSGFDRLDKAALDTVRKWKFRPGQQAGVAVEAIGFLNIPFKIA